MQIVHFTVNPYPHHHYYHEKVFVRKQETLILKMRHHILYGVALINQKRRNSNDCVHMQNEER